MGPKPRIGNKFIPLLLDYSLYQSISVKFNTNNY